MKDLRTEIAARIRNNTYRAKRKDTHEWIEGYLAAYDLICPDYPQDVSNATGLYYAQTPYVGLIEVEPDTVCLTSTLTDCTGKAIHEWDILKDTVGNSFVAIMDKEFRIIGFTIDKEPRIIYVGREPKAQIIGNIFDDPEMLNEAVIDKVLERRGT